MHSNVNASHKILLQGYILTIKEFMEIDHRWFRFHIVLDEGSISLRRESARLSNWHPLGTYSRLKEDKGGKRKVDADGWVKKYPKVNK